MKTLSIGPEQEAEAMGAAYVSSRLFGKASGHNRRHFRTSGSSPIALDLSIHSGHGLQR
jgi:hypothetical protein